jgi:outer membrane autotransporter protein
MHLRKNLALCSLIFGMSVMLGQILGASAEILPPHQLIQLLTADVANQGLIDQGRATPQTLPFLGGSQVTELRTIADGYYIRYFVYDPSRFQNGAVGGWMMLATDVMGKPVNDVKDLYALPQFPNHFVVVKVPAGTLMRTGTAGPISGWGQGSGQQILLMDYISVDDYQTIASLPGTVRSGAFALQSNGRNAGNTATYLDGLPQGDPFAYLQVVRLSLDYLKGPVFDMALNNIGPERYDALNLAGLEQGLMFSRTMMDPAALGMSQQECYTIWGGITGNLAGYDTKGEHTGFDLATGGVMAGIDYLMNSHVSLGFGVGFLQSDLDFPQDGGDGESRSINLGFRGTYRRGRLNIALQINGAALNDQINRKLIFSGVDRTAHGDLDGYRLAAGMEAGWKVELEKNLAIIPYAGISLVRLFHQGFTETNAEDLNLKVQDFEAHTLAPELGIRLTKEFVMSGDFSLLLKAGLAYAPRLPSDDRKIEASLANQGGSFFALGQDEDQHVFMPSLNISAKTIGGLDLHLGYTGNLADGLNSHTFTTTLTYRF